jgi:hypothetical protein
VSGIKKKAIEKFNSTDRLEVSKTRENTKAERQQESWSDADFQREINRKSFLIPCSVNTHVDGKQTSYCESFQARRKVNKKM